MAGTGTSGEAVADVVPVIGVADVAEAFVAVEAEFPGRTTTMVITTVRAMIRTTTAVARVTSLVVHLLCLSLAGRAPGASGRSDGDDGDI